MPDKTWSFLRNPFEYATEGSYTRAAIIGTFTDGALQSNPELREVYAFYHPIVDQFNSMYAIWRSQTGSQKSKTQTLTSLLAEATERINNWEYQVMGHFKKGTPQFNALFPEGHAPFQQGSQQNRINAFKALMISLGEAGLKDIQQQAAEYYEALSQATDTQKGAISQTSQKSGEVEAARVELCHALYKVLGRLMDYYYKSPEAIASYFRLELIQNKPQKAFTGHTAAGAVTCIAQRTLKPTEEVSLLNGGLGNLTFYFADRADAPRPTSGGITLQPGTGQTLEASCLGPVATAHYLMVYNPGPAEGAWEVDI